MLLEGKKNTKTKQESESDSSITCILKSNRELYITIIYVKGDNGKKQITCKNRCIR